MTILPAILGLLALTGCLTWLALRYDPNSLHGRLLRRCTAGFALLLCWNHLTGISLGVNLLSMLTAGTLGLPGVGLLAVMAILP